MQGREGQGNDPWKPPIEPRINGTSKHPSLNGASKRPSIVSSLQETGRQPAIPARPPGMSRVSQPPSTQRVSRPQRGREKLVSGRRRLVFFGCLLGVCVVLAFTLTYAAIKLSEGISSSNGPATTAIDFFTALSQSNSAQAYSDLGPSITMLHNVTQESFNQEAQRLDSCYGPIQSFPEVADSAISQGKTQSYSYTITRKKPGSSTETTYKMRLTFQLDPDSNSWKITDYGDSLGPGQGAPACK